ncbi:hypothetical protein NBM05_08705 [Rothia sp. AR01]|uniref:General stress protein 17M-like domain-containing protein n=1 Tax=Rothia santali TaxID=2949643 RepID=A0A9X2HDF2_9MICC|nr:general stress protein [Rothia santali]MCP3426080.1 hypothetical protein [Rothia santali]
MAISGNSRLAAARAAQLPSAVTVARYPRYEEAQASVDLLAERGFPIQHLSIVGSDLRQVEYVVGALSYAKVAASGALQGLFYGVMLALLLVLFTGDAWLSAFLTAVPLGIAFWVILTVITYSRRGSSRNFTAVGQLVAGTYELVCIPQEAGEARRLLGGQAGRGPLRPTSEQQPGAPAPRPTAEAPSAPPPSASARRRASARPSRARPATSRTSRTAGPASGCGRTRTRRPRRRPIGRRAANPHRAAAPRRPAARPWPAAPPTPTPRIGDRPRRRPRRLGRPPRGRTTPAPLPPRASGAWARMSTARVRASRASARTSPRDPARAGVNPPGAARTRTFRRVVAGTGTAPGPDAGPAERRSGPDAGQAERLPGPDDGPGRVVARP